MILVCSALQDDLRHPNEYIRGATLRFLCRISESEIISPLVFTHIFIIDCSNKGEFRTQASLCKKICSDVCVPYIPEFWRYFDS